MTMQSDIEARFWAKVQRGSPDTCWEWQGSRNHRGYGSITIAGKAARAHRVAWQFDNGAIPVGMMICHRCDNPPCCNPAHLFLGTPQDNVLDMVAKGRHVRGPRDESATNWARGTRNAASKLTDEAVVEIRQRYDAGEVGKRIAERFGISPSLVTLVGRRRAWLHVPEKSDAR